MKKKYSSEEQILKYLWISKGAVPAELFPITPDATDICLELKNLKIIDFEVGVWKIYPKIGRTEIKSFTDVLTIYKKRLNFNKSLKRFKTYDDTKEVRGSEEIWRKIAATILFGLGNKDYKVYLRELGFSDLPSLSELNRTYKKLIKIAHPDAGGSHELATKITEAYSKLKVILKK